MARIEPEELADPERIFVASSLRSAQQAEELLTGTGVSYAVQVEEFGKSFLFNTPRHAAVFYVESGQAAYCRSRLTGAGLGRSVVDDPIEPG